MGIIKLQKKRTRTAQDRLNMITRIAEHCYDHTESWERIGSGDGLAYLFWAIAANDGQPFDTSVAPEKYAELIKLIKSHPDGLWEQLESIGAAI
jgi:hypothetical protein